MTAFLRCARHAPLAAGGVCCGRLDLPPGEDPLVSAQRLQLTLAPPLPEVIWTSPLERCREVAAELARHFGAELRLDERLTEIDFGEWEGRSWKEIEREPAYGAWLASWREVAPPGGEPLRAFESRVCSWLGERMVRQEIRPSALIGHAGIIRALRVLGAGASWDEALAQPVAHLEWLCVPIGAEDR